ncbi:MAG: protein-export chaperone SecB [Magnetococcales bacterium]|nr:protein-export chaperone SecB [Magnetococcales bacterium]
MSEEAADNQPLFHVEKLYLKDLSFESPNAPEIFLTQQEPKVEFNLNTSASKVGDEHYETVLHVTIKVVSGENTMFLVEVSYGGLFLVRNVPQEHLSRTLGIECPYILFPYVRQIISQLVSEGGFKPMVLDPINFAALYQQAQSEAN